MYRINLYPELVEKRRQRRRQALRTASLAMILGLEGLCVISLFLSGLLLRERAKSLRREAQSISAQSQRRAAADKRIDAALELLRVRDGRIVWSPKLAALSRLIDPGLRLQECSGSTGNKTNLDLTGVLRSGGSDLQPVSRFIKALQGEPAVTTDLPQVMLGNLGGGDAGGFRVVCQTRGGDR
jgi:Tfp pilus assembly protein PilN